MEQQTQTSAPRRRGRPKGTKDAAPRKRRSRAEIAAGAQPAKVKKPRESDLQKQFIKWIDMQPAPGMPGHKLGEWVFAVPNGVWIPGDLVTRMRIIMTQRRLGMRKGAPDITIAFPVHDWHGCYIELKRDKDQIAPAQIKDEQRGWLTRLREVGYFVEMAVGLEGACDAVRRYLEGEQPLPFPWETEHDID